MVKRQVRCLDPKPRTRARFYPTLQLGAVVEEEVVVPPGSIAMWSGTLGTIPANWTLCDGGGGTPNLIARFLRGAPAATDPGTTGGSDTHTHASMTSTGGHTHTAQNQTHSHVTNAAGAHHHHGVEKSTSAGPSTTMMTYTGSHSHTTGDSVHSHTMNTTANHTHPISTDDGRPPYYEVAFIQAGVGAAVAANLIIIWTGLLANIPAGWTLCDGGGTRPDLRATFVRGVNTNVTNPGGVGGGATHGHTETAQAAHNHTMNDAAAHFHTHNAYVWTHTHNVGLESGAVANVYQTDAGAGNHTHANTDSIGVHNHNAMGNDGAHSHTVVAASSLPTYYDVAYIINDGGATTIPQGGVLIWTGLLANIPVGYDLCDSGGGRPELRAKFMRGSAAGVNPGGGGGSDTHTHTDQNAGSHSAHSMVSAGAHAHAGTDWAGAHTHSSAANTIIDGAVNFRSVPPQPAGGNHNHTFNSENDHTHTLTDPGNHTHNPWSTDDGRPAFYEVAFIMKA